MDQGKVVQEYNYWGYQVYVVVAPHLEPDDLITVGYNKGEHPGIIVAIPLTKWRSLIELDASDAFLSTTRTLAQSFISNKLARFN